MFREEDHPRGGDGKFTYKGSSDGEKLRKSSCGKRIEHLGRTFAEKVNTTAKHPSGCFFHTEKELSDVPNEENLNPVQSKSEARERGAKGGIKSGEARRKKKALRETLETMLKATLKDPELIKKFGEFGFRSGMSMQDAISAAMIAQAAEGNVKAFVAIRDTIEPKEDETESGGVRVIVEGKVRDLSEGAPDD